MTTATIPPPLRFAAFGNLLCPYRPGTWGLPQCLPADSFGEYMERVRAVIPPVAPETTARECMAIARAEWEDRWQTFRAWGTPFSGEVA